MPSFDPAPNPRAAAGFVPARPGEEARFQPFGSDAGPAPVEAAEWEARVAEAREAGLREGHARGLEEGRVEGRAAASAEVLAPTLRALEDAAGAVAALRRDYLRAHRQGLVELAVAIAEKLLRRSLEARPEELAALVERALDASGGSDGDRLELAPADLERLEAGGGEALSRLVAERGLEVCANPRLQPGDSRVLSGASRVDARVQELLRRIGEDLCELLLEDVAAPGDPAADGEGPS